jgi:hypothetical protein
VSHALSFSHPCPQHSCDFVPRCRGETWERNGCPASDLRDLVGY